MLSRHEVASIIKNDSEPILDHIACLLNTVLDSEWDYVEDHLYNDLEPNQTPLWSALMLNYKIAGYGNPPHKRFEEELSGIQVSEDGRLLNRREFLNEDDGNT